MHVLRTRDFALFLGGRFFAVLAAQMQWVGIGWYLYNLTGDPMTLGWAGLASFLPIAFFTLPAGDLADRVDRRLLLAAAHLIQATGKFTRRCPSMVRWFFPGRRGRSRARHRNRWRRSSCRASSSRSR